MPHLNKSDRRLSNNPKLFPRSTRKIRKITTVSDILTQDDVKTVLDKLIKKQDDICDMICIYHNHEGYVGYFVTSESTVERITYMMEQAKIWMLTEESDE